MFDKLDLVVWKQLQDVLASIYNVSVYTIDINGEKLCSSRELPFFCQLMEKKGLCKEWRKKYEVHDELCFCHANLLNIVIPIHVNGRTVGSLIVSPLSNAPKINDDEERDASKSLRQFPDERINEIKNAAKSFVHLMVKLAFNKKSSDEKLEELSLSNDFSRFCFSSIDSEQSFVLRALDFFVKRLGCFNASFVKENSSIRHHPDQKYDLIEPLLFRHLKHINSSFYSSDISKDHLFKSSQNIEGSVLALPLSHNQSFLGVLCLYNCPNNEFVNAKALAEYFSFFLFQVMSVKEIARTAVTDGLTGLYNKQYFSELVKSELSRSSRIKSPTALLLLDIDDFKKFNDTFGHLEGDHILQSAGALIKKTVSPLDVPCRFGGEEFAVLLPHTDPNSAKERAELLRSAFHDSCRLTVSAGCFVNTTSSLSYEEMFAEADKALYRAKQSGKNKVVSLFCVDKSLGIIDY